MTYALNLPAGAKIKNLREARGLSQMALAYELGFATSGSISKIESGKFPLSKEHAQIFAMFFKVPETIFYAGASNEND